MEGIEALKHGPDCPCQACVTCMQQVRDAMAVKARDMGMSRAIGEAMKPEAPQVTLEIGVDKQSKQVVLTLSTSGGGRDPIKVRVNYEPSEAARLASTLVKAAMEVTGAGATKASYPPLVLPQRNGTRPDRFPGLTAGK